MDAELQKALNYLGEQHQAALDIANGEVTKLHERLDAIEIAGQRPGIGQSTPANQAFYNFIRRDLAGVPEVERVNLALNPDTGGGYLAPRELELSILKSLTVISPIRQYAQVTTTSMTGVSLPVLTGRPTTRWVGEIEQRQSTDMSYGNIEIPTHESSSWIPISQQLLEDSAFNIEGEVREAFSIEYSLQENQAFVTGDGFKRPKGFLTESGIIRVKTDTAATLTADSLIDLYYSLPDAYARVAVWGMKRTTMAKVRKLKDGDGQYLWSNGLADGQPPTILGRPVIEIAEMPEVGAGLLPIVFGDFSGYRIVDRIGLSFLRDPFSLSDQGQVKITARRRVGGGTTQTEKFRLLEVGTI